MRVSGLLTKEKLSTNLNETYVVPDLDKWFPGYSELPDHEKIMVDIKHLTAGDLLTEFQGLQGGYARRSFKNNDLQIFLNHAYKVYGIETEDGAKVEDPLAITKVGKGNSASICAEIIVKTVDHLYEMATITQGELKN